MLPFSGTIDQIVWKPVSSHVPSNSNPTDRRSNLSPSLHMALTTSDWFRRWWNQSRLRPAISMYHLFVRERSHFKYRSCHISFGGNKLTRALRVSGCKGPDGISARQGERNVALYVSPICRLALLRLGFYAQPVVRAALRGWRPQEKWSPFWLMVWR